MIRRRFSPDWVFSVFQKRWMATNRRVQDRSPRKKMHDLEFATERWKSVSKILTVIEALKKEPEQVISLRHLEKYRQQINLSKQHKLEDFIRKSPKLFELYKDKKGVVWCGFTEKAEHLLEEEARILEEHSPKAAEYVTRLLMMSVDKRLPVDKVIHFRREMGLPLDFRQRWIHMFPEHFKVVRGEEDDEYLQLVSWNPSWAVTELEKKALAAGVISELQPEPGVLSLPFPMKFPRDYKVYRHDGRIELFQKRSYLSPYADARGLMPGSQEFDKRAVAVMHEILSFTTEKRLLADQLTYFRREFVMPQKLMRILLKHFALFYVSERGKRFSVFLTEAYDRLELIDKCPLVLWKEKVRKLSGHRGRRKRGEDHNEMSEFEDDLIDTSREKEIAFVEVEDDEALSADEEDDSEMDIGEVNDAYRD